MLSNLPLARANARPQTRFTPELGRLICERISEGQSERSLVLEPGMPSVQAIYKWRVREPGFGAAYDAAKLAGKRVRLGRDRDVDAERRWRASLRVRDAWRKGRESLFTPELAEAICQRVAGGETVVSIGADPAMPCAPAIYNWVRARGEFREMYQAAKAIAADLLFDLALDIALESTEATVRSDRLRIQTLRWQAAALAPKKYDPRLAAVEEEPAKPRYVVVIRKFSQTREEALIAAGIDPETHAPLKAAGA